MSTQSISQNVLFFNNKRPDLEKYIASFLDAPSVNKARLVCKAWSLNPAFIAKKASLHNTNIRFLNNYLPTDIKNCIFSFLDPLSMVRAAKTCYVWNKDPFLQERIKKIKEMDLSLQKDGYPLKAIRVLRKNGIEFQELPIIDQSTIGHLNYLSERHLGLNAITRVKNLSGMVGIAFYVQPKIKGTFKACEVKIKITDIQGVVSFIPGSSKKPSWQFDFKNNENGTLMYINDAYGVLHNTFHSAIDRLICPACPSAIICGGDANYKYLDNLLSGNDPGFKITAPPIKEDKSEEV